MSFTVLSYSSQLIGDLFQNDDDDRTIKIPTRCIHFENIKLSISKLCVWNKTESTDFLDVLKLGSTFLHATRQNLSHWVHSVTCRLDVIVTVNECETHTLIKIYESDRTKEVKQTFKYVFIKSYINLRTLW